MPGRLTICIALAVSLLRVQAGGAVERYALRNSVSPRATAAARLRAADPDEYLEMSVTLRLRDADQLAALIAEQQDPASPRYHRWLTPDAFDARFAPIPQEYGAVVGWLQSEGFAVRAKVSGARIDFGGTVMQVERCFGVHMNHYSYRGRAPLANDDAPVLPAELRDTVAFVRLNTFPLAEPLVRLSDGTQTLDAMAPADMYVAYDAQPLLDAGTNGAGQTIAVVARSDFNLSDVASFEQQFGVPAHDPIKVFASTNPGIGAPNGVCKGIRNSRQLAECLHGEETEVLLDTEWVSAMAPGATVLVDVSGADVDISLMDIVTQHADAKTITMSFGACERLDSSDLALFAPLYAQAAVQGQSVLVSTGDGGADGCQDGRGPSINVLASDPNVTAVGGTTLDPGFDSSGDAHRLCRRDGVE
jgi:subtilase family serine protease